MRCAAGPGSQQEGASKKSNKSTPIIIKHPLNDENMLSSFTWSCDFAPCEPLPLDRKVTNDKRSSTNSSSSSSGSGAAAARIDRDRERRLERSALAREHRGESMLFFQTVLKKLSHIRPVDQSMTMDEQVPTSMMQCLPCFADSAISLAYFDQLLYAVQWSSIPLSLQPMGGFIPANRIERKTRQVLRMVQLAAALILQRSRHPSQKNKRLRIVEFCAGSGFVLLPLVALFPEHEFVLIDMKEPSLDIARQRIALCGDTRLQDNVRIISGLIQDFQEDFDVGIALHACGSASDIALDK